MSSDPAVSTDPQGQPAVPLAPVPLDTAVAHVFGAVYAIVFLQIVKMLFPGIPLSALTVEQDSAATTLAAGLVRGGAARLGGLASLPPLPLTLSREEHERALEQLRATVAGIEVVTPVSGGASIPV